MGTLKDRYCLKTVIGRGASGSVWVAQDLKLGRPVAIKQLDRQLADDLEACARFEREAWTIAQLKSPHIVQVFDSGVEAGVPYIVMELLEGESLDRRLSRYTSRPSPHMATSIIADVARGLNISHQAGIVHRDLKPGNVFLARENRREVAKLLDFGIAGVVADEGGTGPISLAGTPQFMSPEHFGGHPLDQRADVWSFAVLAYLLLTGRLPFAGDALKQLRSQICACNFTPPSELVPDLHPDIDQVFHKAFARSPHDRFANATELAIAIEELASDRARPPVIRVLFVDDEADMEALLRYRLRREVASGRYELLFARSGDEALETLATRPDIDVAFADINMPGSTTRADQVGREGLWFLEQVPAVTPFVRVVMLSAHYENREFVRTAMNHGAFDFLKKPIDFADLRQTVEKCAADARTLRKLSESHRENEVLRGLVGRSLANRMMAEVRAADAQVASAQQASVALIWVPEILASSANPQQVFARLNSHFDLFVPEVQGRQGSVHSFVGACMVVLFHGRDHASRAVDACVSIVERVHMANSMTDMKSDQYCAAASVGTGTLLEGRLGSTLVGRIEHSLLGAPMDIARELAELCRPFEVLVSAGLAPELKTQYRCEVDLQRTAKGAPVWRVLGPLAATPTLQSALTETREAFALAEI